MLKLPERRLGPPLIRPWGMQGKLPPAALLLSGPVLLAAPVGPAEAAIRIVQKAPNTPTPQECGGGGIVNTGSVTFGSASTAGPVVAVRVPIGEGSAGSIVPFSQSARIGGGWMGRTLAALMAVTDFFTPRRLIRSLDY
jgi:hypothetical protein